MAGEMCFHSVIPADNSTTGGIPLDWLSVSIEGFRANSRNFQDLPPESMK